MKPCAFQAKLGKKTHPGKVSYTSGNGNLERTSYTSGNQTFLYFGGWYF